MYHKDIHIELLLDLNSNIIITNSILNQLLRFKINNFTLAGSGVLGAVLLSSVSKLLYDNNVNTNTIYLKSDEEGKPVFIGKPSMLSKSVVILTPDYLSTVCLINNIKRKYNKELEIVEIMSVAEHIPKDNVIKENISKLCDNVKFH